MRTRRRSLKMVFDILGEMVGNKGLSGDDDDEE